MLPTLPVAHGSDTIRKFNVDWLSDLAASEQFTVDKVDVARSGDLAYMRGSFTVTGTDPKTKKTAAWTASYVLVFKKQADDGAWKPVEDIGSPTLTAPTPAQ